MLTPPTRNWCLPYSHTPVTLPLQRGLLSMLLRIRPAPPRPLMTVKLPPLLQRPPTLQLFKHQQARLRPLHHLLYLHLPPRPVHLVQPLRLPVAPPPPQNRPALRSLQLLFPPLLSQLLPSLISLLQALLGHPLQPPRLPQQQQQPVPPPARRRGPWRKSDAGQGQGISSPIMSGTMTTFTTTRPEITSHSQISFIITILTSALQPETTLSLLSSSFRFSGLPLNSLSRNRHGPILSR